MLVHLQDRVRPVFSNESYDAVVIQRGGGGGGGGVTTAVAEGIVVL